MPEVRLPTLHPGQVAAYLLPGKRKAIRCGRRWGKTALEVAMACDRATKGQRVGIFAPENKFLDEPYDEIVDVLDPVLKSSTRNKGRVRTTTGGHIDFWTLDNERAGRGRRYHLVMIDEAAFTKNAEMLKIWNRAIEPTLIDYAGDAVAFSNTNGVDPTNFFWWICNDPKSTWVGYHAPAHANPYLPRSELDRLKREKHPLEYRQEVLAEFVDFSGEAFFNPAWLLVNGKGVPWPERCDYLCAVIDTAMKDKAKHDGTAVSYYAVNLYTGVPMVLLDWDILSIEGHMLETWLPSVFTNLQAYAKRCGARSGILGAYIEDRGSGTILLGQARAKNLPVHALPESLTAAGKSGRALNASGHVYQGKLKMSQQALDKLTDFKGVFRNHWLAQVTGFRVGVDEGQADDLLDTMTYGVAVTLGNAEGN